METVYRDWRIKLPLYAACDSPAGTPTCEERVEVVVETSSDIFEVSRDRMALDEFIETLRANSFILKDGEKAAIMFSSTNGYDGDPGEIEYSCSVVRYENDEEYAARQVFLKSHYEDLRVSEEKRAAVSEQKEREAYERLKMKFEGGS